MRLNFGFLEIMLISGVWLYSQAFGLSLTLIISAIISKFLLFVLEWDQKKQAKENTAKAVEDLSESIKKMFGAGKSGVNTKQTFH